MRIKGVDSLQGGEILAEPILTKENEILIPKGTVLKKDYVPLIQELELESVMVEDPYLSYEEPHFILSEERHQYYVERIRKVLESHIYHGKGSLKVIEPLSRELVDEINALVTDNMIIDMDERNADLYEHSIMVTLLSIIISKKMKLKKKQQYSIAIGCLLHDLGLRYITVPIENCNWNQEQPIAVFEFKKHTILAYSALEEETWLPAISKKMILSHHERMDGSGFPLKQKNTEIECKIIQACDAFDCMISGMECKRLSIQEALSYMKEKAGIEYEEEIVNHIISMVAKYPVGTTIKTSEEENGVVVSQTSDPENPIIMILDQEMKCNDEKKYNLEIDKNISILQVV